MASLKLNSLFFFFFFALATFIPALTAHKVHHDVKNTITAGSLPSDGNTTMILHKKDDDDINKDIMDDLYDNQLDDFKHGSSDAGNDTRRELRQIYSGPCAATNPIDRCWRCNSNWANNRKRLADCALGFGSGAIGGKFGGFYVVTSSADHPTKPVPGTLRHAVIQKKPLWIIFRRSMTIRLSQPLMMQSYKTIDGRGVSVSIAYGAGITIQNSHHIIIHNIHIHNIVPTPGGNIRDSIDHIGQRTHDDGDGINLFTANNIWLDHLSMTRCADGLIDAIEGSTAITISNSHFTDHDKAMLFGARDDNPVDAKMRITVVYNHFGKRLMQRMPRCRTGFFHLVNNDYTHWNMYAIGGSSHATIISQGNRFVAQTHLPIGQEYKKEITHRDGHIPVSVWKRWTWVSDKDLFVNGAHFTQSGDLNGARTYRALELIKPAPAYMVKDMTKFAGYLGCIPGRRC